MKRNDCLCRRYKLPNNTGWEEKLIGFELLREPSASAPGLFALTEISRSIVNGKSQEWKQTKIATSCEAFSFEAIPMVVMDQEKQYRSDLIKQGYVYQNDVLINLDTNVFEVISTKNTTTTSLTGLAINWLFSRPSSLSINIFKGFVTGVFTTGANLIGFEVGRIEASDMLPDVLMRTDSGYELSVNSGLGENSIHPVTLVGAGELRSEHGHKALLMLIYLQQRFADEFPNVEKPLVAFCNEQGDILDFKCFDSIKPFIESFGFNYDQVRADAEMLGLAHEVIHFRNIDSDKEDLFF